MITPPAMVPLPDATASEIIPKTRSCTSVQSIFLRLLVGSLCCLNLRFSFQEHGSSDLKVGCIEFATRLRPGTFLSGVHPAVERGYSLLTQNPSPVALARCEAASRAADPQLTGELSCTCYGAARPTRHGHLQGRMTR